MSVPQFPQARLFHIIRVSLLWPQESFYVEGGVQKRRIQWYDGRKTHSPLLSLKMEKRSLQPRHVGSSKELEKDRGIISHGAS